MWMPKAVYLLIFLTFSAQFDDVLLTPSSLAGCASVAANDDEYLSVERDRARERTASLQKSALDALMPKIAGCDSFAAKSDALPGSRIDGLTRLSPLYALMSLQL
jgi:hypothetical protein